MLIINNVRKHKVDVIVIFAADADCWNDAGGDDDGQTRNSAGVEFCSLRNL